LQNSALHRKLVSKNEALKIMRAEVERFRTERDQFKLMAETVQIRYKAMKSSLESSEYSDTFGTSSNTLGFLLNQTREKNLALQTETETLRQKLHELQGDIKLLRSRNLEMTKLLKAKEAKSKHQDSDELQKQWNEEKSKLIDQLEGLKKKNAQLQFDFRSLLDEKEEIVTERDAFKCKAHRLNHELSVTLKGSETIDIDALILENKFLQERTVNLESELQHSKKSGNKMQSLLEQKKVKGIIKLGDDRNNQMIMSHKQGWCSIWHIPMVLIFYSKFLLSISEKTAERRNSFGASSQGSNHSRPKSPLRGAPRQPQRQIHRAESSEKDESTARRKNSVARAENGKTFG
jgi:hypothetical protein